ncbi:MAG: hypothetical protein ABIQ49_14905, partial [Gemmatimonadales bacterium]
AGLYPMAQRLILFVVPVLVVLGVAGLDATVGLSGARWERPAWLGASVGMVLPLLWVSVLQGAKPDAAPRMAGLVKELAPRRAGEPVYVFGRALPAWEFYTTDWSYPDHARLAFLDRVARSDGPAFENSPSRERPVARTEGADLWYRSSRGQELIGLPTGMEYRAGGRLSRRRPDAGWVPREADRIQGAASPGVWVVMAEFFGPEYELLEELKRRGGAITYGRSWPGHILFRYEFPRPTAGSR